MCIFTPKIPAPPKVNVPRPPGPPEPTALTVDEAPEVAEAHETTGIRSLMIPLDTVRS